MTAPINILLTSVGRRASLARSFRRALDSGIATGRVIGTDLSPLAPALHSCDKFYLVPGSKEPGWVDAIVEICRREDIRLVVPLTDIDLPIVSRERARLEAEGARVLVAPDPAIRIGMDKQETIAFFQREGIPAPKSTLYPETPDVPMPWILKPRYGSASLHVYKVADRAEYEFYAPRVPDAVVQELVPGPEYTIDVFADFDGRVLSAVPRERFEVRAGEIQKGRTLRDDEVIDYSIRIVKGLGGVGPFAIQCKRDGAAVKFFEINTRFGGGTPLSIAAGADSPANLVRILAGQPPVECLAGAFREDLYFTRADTEYFIPDLDDMKRRGQL